MQHRKAPKSAGSTEPISPVLPGIFPVWVLFGSNQISKNSIRQKSDGKQEKTLGFPKKPKGRWSECRDSNPGPLGPEPSAIPNFATPRYEVKREREEDGPQPALFFWRRHPDLNWGIRILQTLALPLGYGAEHYIIFKKKCFSTPF